MDKFFQFISNKIKYKKNLISKYLNNIFHYRKFSKIETAKNNNKFINKDINDDYINKISNKQKIIKKRNAAIDLLRIITMIGIVCYHVLYHGNGINKYRRYYNKLDNLYTYFFWHNNVYALISGIVGYKSTKYSNLLYSFLFSEHSLLLSKI